MKKSNFKIDTTVNIMKTSSFNAPGTWKTAPPTTLPFFPSSLPDELLGSRCSRFHIQRGNQKTRETYFELFGSAPFQISNLFASRIHALASRLPGDTHSTARRLTHESTLIPLVTLLKTSGRGTGMRIADRKSIGEDGATKVCIDCINEDAHRYGTPYLHRSHNLPIATVCWKHETKLLNRCPACSCPIELPNDLVLAPWAGCVCGIQYSERRITQGDSASTVEIELAKFVHEVLNGIPEDFIAKRISSIIHDEAIAQGFRWGADKVARRKLLKALEDHYTPKLLSSIDPAYSKGRASQWLNFMGHHSQAHEVPIARILLLANFIFSDGISFLNALNSAKEPRAPSAAKIISASSNRDLLSQDKAEANALDIKIYKLVDRSSSQGLSFEQLWHRYSGEMKKLARHGGPAALQKLRLTIEVRSVISEKKASRRAAHPKDAEWAEQIRMTATRLYNDPGIPVRVTMSALVRKTQFRPETWPTASSFPLTRAQCEESQETRSHFYARRIMWAMSKHAGRTVPRSAITEYSGLEHHRANDVYHYLTSINVVVALPFISHLEAKGIYRDWSGPCPDKVYKKTGRHYVKTGKRVAYVAPTFPSTALPDEQAL